jgi:hypothetical protein
MIARSDERLQVLASSRVVAISDVAVMPTPPIRTCGQMSDDKTVSGGPSPSNRPFTAIHRENRRRASARSCRDQQRDLAAQPFEHAEQFGRRDLVDSAQ